MFCYTVVSFPLFFRRLISEILRPIVTKLCHMFDGNPDLYNKLRHRRETARQLRLSRLARALQWTLQLLYNYRTAKVVSTLTVKNRPTGVADEVFWHYTFKVTCLCIIRKPLRAFIIIYITNGHSHTYFKISEKWRRIMWTRKLSYNRRNDLAMRPIYEAPKIFESPWDAHGYFCRNF